MPFTIRRIKDVAGAVDKYERNVAAGADDWLDGYKNPRRDPRATAVKAQGRWHNTVSAADTQARYAKNVGDYNVEEAIGIATAVGKDHYVTGAVARKAKVGRKLANIFKEEAALLVTIDAMPTDTLAQRLAKATAFANGMAAKRGTF